MSHFAGECKNFRADVLCPEVEERLAALARKCRGDILTMTTLAGCGHPGGSMSSIEMYVTLFALANVDPAAPHAPTRDRVVISHGHTSPGAYSTLGNLGFFPVDDAIAHFRQAGSPYEGHVEHGVPGIEWSSGNLGQGLSAGCGMALASRLQGFDGRVFVVMGDGEQQKGQISEARRFAAKYRLGNLTCLVDRNYLQISGRTDLVMPQNLEAEFAADGWDVLEVDGHDLKALYAALHKATSNPERPAVILARTTMGKGVPFMEDDEKWHGQAVPESRLGEALEALGIENRLDHYKTLRARGACHLTTHVRPHPELCLNPGTPRLYPVNESNDNRSAWGNALADLAEANRSPEATPLVVFDCDLAGSVKTGAFAKAAPERFIQCGIMEQHAAVASGALSVQGVQVFWSDFGVFGVDEVYNQMRVNDINETNLKLVCTHVGTDVGEDGKTHQCIDYLGLLRNLFGFRCVVPADPNQTDRVIRWAALQPGNIYVGMGRSKLRPLARPDGEAFFGKDYEFRYGRADILRDGADAAVATMGCMVPFAVQAADELASEGLRVAVMNFSCPTDIHPEDLATASRSGIVVSYEDHHVNTGLGASLALAMMEQGSGARLVRLGIDSYQPSGTPEELWSKIGLDKEGLKETLRRLIRERKGK